MEGAPHCGEGLICVEGAPHCEVDQCGGCTTLCVDQCGGCTTLCVDQCGGCTTLCVDQCGGCREVPTVVAPAACGRMKTSPNNTAGLELVCAGA